MPGYISERLSAHHERRGFDCSVPELDRWLIDHASHAQSMRTAQTFVWHAGDGRVLAYFSLAGHLVDRGVMPAKAGRGSPRQIPSVSLARLALVRDLHGSGLGSELLWDALGRARHAADIAAARLVVVDAIDANAAKFYEHHGFVPVPQNAFRLVQKMSSIAVALDAGVAGVFGADPVAEVPDRDERDR